MFNRIYYVYANINNFATKTNVGPGSTEREKKDATSSPGHREIEHSMK